MIDSTRWSGRPHRGPKARVFELRTEERARIEAVVGTPSTEQRVAKRAQAVLLFADGVATADVAMLVGINYRTARKWKKRFTCESPSEKLADAPRSGRPPSLSRVAMPQP